MTGLEYGRFDLWRASAAAELAEARTNWPGCWSCVRAMRGSGGGARRLPGAGRGGRLRDGGVLDVGCGSGAVARDVARRVRADGQGRGPGPSPGLARRGGPRLVQRDGLAEAVELRLGDARALPFPDAEFNVVLAATTLAHVPGGGRGRFQSWCGSPSPRWPRGGLRPRRGRGHPRPARARALTPADRLAASSDHLLVNGWLTRPAPRRLRFGGNSQAAGRRAHAAGLHPARARPGTASRPGWRSGGPPSPCRPGPLPRTSSDGWLAALRAERADQGGSFGGQTHLFVWGTRPH